MADLFIATFHSINFDGSQLISGNAYPGESYSEVIERISKKYRFVLKDELSEIRTKDDWLYLLNQSHKPLWIFTFDDGYIDHKVAAEKLSEVNAGGIFFIPTCVLEGEILIANLLHILVRRFGSLRNVLDEVERRLDRRLFEKFSLFFEKSAPSIRLSSFDTRDDFCIKIGLQEIGYRSQVGKAIKEIQEEFCPEVPSRMYLDEMDIQIINESGSLIGGHGSSHRRLTLMSRRNAREEIIKSIKFLSAYNNGPLHFAYPYGCYDEILESILLDSGFDAIHTIDHGLNLGSKFSASRLKRIDAKKINEFL